MQYYKNEVNSSSEEKITIWNKDKRSSTGFPFMLGFSVTDHETDSAIVFSTVHAERTYDGIK